MDVNSHTPEMSNPTSHVSFFAWTWTSKFMQTPNMDYFFVANLGQASKTQFVSSSVAFTLLTNSPPCITIKSGSQTTNCSKPDTLMVHNGTSVTIAGSNWRLGWEHGSSNEQVMITISCEFSCTSSTEILYTGTIPVAPSGSFSISVPLPSNTGIFMVMAYCIVPTTNVLGGNANTLANNTLSFGEPDDATGLTLMLS